MLYFLIAFILCVGQIMASDIIIRPIKGDDWKNFRQMRVAQSASGKFPKRTGLPGKMNPCRIDEEWKVICQDAQAGKGKWYVVAEHEGKLIGMLGAVELFGAYMRHQVEIIQAYVMPEFRRRELMTKLFEALKTELQKIDHLEQMIVWVTLSENQVGTAMFEKFGFNLAGKLTKTVRFEGQYYDCCWLEAPLGR